MENKNDFKQNDYQNNNNQNGNWQSSNYQNGNNQNGNWQSSNYQSSNYQNNNYQGNNGNYNRNSGDLGEDIRNLVQETLDAIDYGGLGAKINRAVNDGIEQIRKQVEQGKRQGGPYNGNNYNGAYNGQPNGGQAYRAQQNYREQPYMDESRSKRSSKRNTELYPADIVTHYPAGRVSGILLQVFGGIGFATSLVTSIVFGSLFFAGFGKFTVVALGITLPLFLMSIIMIKFGGALHKLVKRFYEYVRLFGGKRYCDIKVLAKKTGRSPKSVIKDLKKMMKKGMFPQACLDDEEKTLILDHEVYDEYIEMKKNREEAAKAAKRESEEKKDISEMTDEERLIEEGKLYLKQIKEANDAIPGEEISQKLERLELITGKIFSYVSSHSEKAPEIRKFMDYYMPTTLKLVYAYKEFDAQDIQGDTIKTAKEEIEHSLDMVNKAFENLFDSLFQEEAMDISSDISVLKTMFKQEGLMGSDFRKEKDDE